jgi:hypothetical protein
VQTHESLLVSCQILHKAHNISAITFGTDTCGLLSVGTGRGTSMRITVLGKTRTVVVRVGMFVKRVTGRFTGYLALIIRSRGTPLSCT